MMEFGVPMYQLVKPIAWRLGIRQMVEYLEQAFLMVELFRLSVSLDSNWLVIVHCAVSMADGIPVFQYAKVRRLL